MGPPAASAACRAACSSSSSRPSSISRFSSGSTSCILAIKSRCRCSSASRSASSCSRFFMNLSMSRSSCVTMPGGRNESIHLSSAASLSSSSSVFASLTGPRCGSPRATRSRSSLALRTLVNSCRCSNILRSASVLAMRSVYPVKNESCESVRRNCTSRYIHFLASSSPCLYCTSPRHAEPYLA